VNAVIRKGQAEEESMRWQMMSSTFLPIVTRRFMSPDWSIVRVAIEFITLAIPNLTHVCQDNSS
jgi:hypothetical protein